MIGKLVINVGVQGKFIFLYPWESEPEIIFRCDRIATIADFIKEQKIDVYEEVYKSAGLGRDDYESAVSRGIRLITLSSYGRDSLTIPEDYIEKYPDTNYVNYPRTMISVDLGLLPEGISLSSILTHIDEYIIDYMNVRPTSRAHTLESGVFIGFDEHRELEESRLSGVSTDKTSWQRIRTLESENEALSTTVRELEDELVAR